MKTIKNREDFIRYIENLGYVKSEFQYDISSNREEFENPAVEGDTITIWVTDLFFIYEPYGESRTIYYDEIVSVISSPGCLNLPGDRFFHIQYE